MTTAWRSIAGVLTVAVCVAGPWAEGQEGAGGRERKVVSTTIDFLDYCFFNTEPDRGYFSEEEYEEVIKAIARAGISKVYLRVDVCGKTLYPSTAGTQYTGDGRDPGSRYLVNTLERYDPAAKTIELGHKYGMEVWCWDTLFDDEATMVHYAPDSELGRTYGEYPLKDPFLVENPHLQWRLDPQIEKTQQELLSQRENAGPVEAIRITSDITGRQNRIGPGEVTLYVSNDNHAFTKVEKPVTFVVEQVSPPVLVFKDLDIDQQFIKLVLNKPQPKDNSFTIAGLPEDMVEVYYDGQWHRTSAGWRDQREAPERSGFSFRGGGRFAWDYASRVLGVARFPQILPLHYGIIELSYDEAKRHKLNKMKELARYNFDGFAYSMRTHSQSRKPTAYGYNEPVRQAFKTRYGRDIWTEEFDRDAWLDLRAEAVNAYLRQVRPVLGGRPFYMDTPEEDSRYVWQYGGLPFQHEAWLRQGSVTGLRMMGYDVDTALRPLVPGADEVEVIRFVDNSSMPSVEVFTQRLLGWLDEPGLDEVEYYETLLYTNQPAYLDAIRSALEAKGMLPPSAAKLD